MSDPSLFPQKESDGKPWERAYLAAVLETDQGKMALRIGEAFGSIDERLRSPIDRQSKEYVEILRAWKALETLRAERLDGRAEASSCNTD